MAWIVWLVSVGAIVFSFIRESYVGELVSSFLPYVVFFWICCAVIALWVVIVSKKQRTRVVSGLSFVVLIVMSVWGGEKITTFYEWPVWDWVDIWSGSFSLFYNNIYVYNENYDALASAIEYIDPDVLILVEFARHHWSAFMSFFETLWLEYTNRINRDTIYDSNLFASHYPIDEVVVYGWLDAYINIESQVIRLDGREVMFHVVHLISPINRRYFLARNQQLETLSWLMNQAVIDYPDRLHILIGDFNTSPWSVHYSDFIADLDEDWSDQTRQVPFFMTRKAPYISWLRVHIDHVFTWWDVQILMDPFWVAGSDHQAISIEVLY